MRFLLLLLPLLGSLFLTLAQAAYQPVPLTEGQKAPDFTLPAVDGKDYALKDFTGAKVHAVIFTTNHCPDAIASHGRMVVLVDHFQGQSVNFVAINSNSPSPIPSSSAPTAKSSSVTAEKSPPSP